MQAVLVMFRNDGERRSFSLTREMTVIGRRQDCDLMIPLGEISRKHCRIVRDGESLRLEDLGSSNGTFHNGKRIQEAVLAAGDTIQVGPVAFVVQIDGVPADDEIQPQTSAGVRQATLDDDDLDTLTEDIDRSPSDELDVLGGDDSGLHDLEQEENLEILDSDDSAANVSLDDKKSKRGQ